MTGDHDQHVGTRSIDDVRGIHVWTVDSVHSDSAFCDLKTWLIFINVLFVSQSIILIDKESMFAWNHSRHV